VLNPVTADPEFNTNLVIGQSPFFTHLHFPHLVSVESHAVLHSTYSFELLSFLQNTPPFQLLTFFAYLLA